MPANLEENQARHKVRQGSHSPIQFRWSLSLRHRVGAQKIMGYLTTRMYFYVSLLLQSAMPAYFA